jgi:CHAD domain-containing protein
MDRKYEQTIEHVTAAVAHATEQSRRHHAEETHRVARVARRRLFTAAPDRRK